MIPKNWIEKHMNIKNPNSRFKILMQTREIKIAGIC
jgi:hypothetical protein